MKKKIIIGKNIIKIIKNFILVNKNSKFLKNNIKI